ncbi:toxin TumE [[Limnothrix rosea] IAM M-220]|uniref:toxin TumE n=1 Tax=[Limnothrix rosea] IAM M-220 TaxID=454133 RepID=UPI00096861F6|nr:DUF6516 family protein [[Limnothrix rosea] IAM M-220]OKH16929.1 hypothetical protein NIES208_11590 [[Limnothrix rosea] IAM M-220]
MLRNQLQKYLQGIETEIIGLTDLYVEKYVEEILTDTRVNLRIRLRSSSGYLLEMHEAICVSPDEVLEYLDYRYHFQDSQNQLIFRYDSTPHFPDLSSFPHHKHLKDRVIACSKPTIETIIHEVTAFLDNLA